MTVTKLSIKLKQAAWSESDHPMPTMEVALQVDGSLASYRTLQLPGNRELDLERYDPQIAIGSVEGKLMPVIESVKGVLSVHTKRVYESAKRLLLKLEKKHGWVDP